MIDGAYIYTGTVTAKQIAANAIDTDHLAVGMNPNLVRYGLDTMEQFSTVPYFTKPATTNVTLDDSQYYIGTKSIKLSGTTASNYVLLGSQVTDYGCIPVVTGKKYILSCYVKTSSTTFMNVALGAVGHTDISTSSLTYPVTGTKILRASDGWVRCFAKFTATSDCPYISMRINVGDANTTAWFDAFQLEEVDDINKEPGTFKQAGTTIINGENITTGTIKSYNYKYNSGNFSASGTMINLANGSIRCPGLYIDSYGRTYLDAEITTTGGSIACWTINQKSLFKGSAILGKAGDDNIYFGDDGLSMSDKFIYRTSTGELEINGKILASSGYIGDKVSGFTIGSKAIYNGMTNLASSATGIYLGTDGISLGGGKIKATSDGKFYATDADISGIINATSGSFKGTIEAQIINILNKMSIYYNDLGVKKLTSVIEIPNRTSEGAHSDLMIGGDTSYLTLKASDQIRSYTPLNIMNSIMEYGVSLSNKYQAKGSYSASNHTHTAAQVGAATATHSHSAAQIGAAASSHQHGQLHQDGKAVVTTSNGGTIFRAAEVRGNNVVTLGSSTYKWTRLWAVQGTISTSDRNEKTNIEPLDERYEKLFMDLKPKMFNWKNFTNKDHHDRRHCGLIAQDVEDATYANGLSPELFAAVCKDNLEKPTEDGRNWSYGLIYSELHGLEIHMIQKNIAETFELKSQIMSLRNENDNLKSINDEIIKRLEKIEKIIDVF